MVDLITTKATWLGHEYGCRIFYDGRLVLEGMCPSRDLIGPTFRDLMRTLDKLGGNKFTWASRHRRCKPGNVVYDTIHTWHR